MNHVEIFRSRLHIKARYIGCTVTGVRGVADTGVRQEKPTAVSHGCTTLGHAVGWQHAFDLLRKGGRGNKGIGRLSDIVNVTEIRPLEVLPTASASKDRSQ